MFQPTRPRGARPQGRPRRHRRPGFNPRAREGRDAPSAWAARCSLAFQPTRPRGARPGSSLRRRTAASFNPRAREGRDGRRMRPCPAICCFNPRAREGRDLRLLRTTDRLRLVSTHAPARGATAAVVERSVITVGFNPRAREGRDGNNNLADATVEPFQPTRPRGARQVRGRLDGAGAGVSTHAPARGATLTEASGLI